MLSKKTAQVGVPPLLSRKAMRAAIVPRKRDDELDFTHMGNSGRLVRLSTEAIAQRDVAPPTPLPALTQRQERDMLKRIVQGSPATKSYVARALACYDERKAAYATALLDAADAERAEVDAKMRRDAVIEEAAQEAASAEASEVDSQATRATTPNPVAELREASEDYEDDDDDK